MSNQQQQQQPRLSNSPTIKLTTTTSNPTQFKMKTNFLLILATITATVLAGPEANPQNDNFLAKRETCHKPSSCGRAWADKCEDYCKPYKFSHMSDAGCGALAEKCCCDTQKV